PPPAARAPPPRPPAPRPPRGAFPRPPPPTQTPAGPRLTAGPRSVRRPGTRPAGPAHLSRLARQPPRVGQRAPQEELDLGVGAAQLVSGPPGQGVVNGWVQPQQYALALAHWAVTGKGSRCSRPAGWPARCTAPRAGWTPWPPSAPRPAPPRPPPAAAAAPAAPCPPLPRRSASAPRPRRSPAAGAAWPGRSPGRRTAGSAAI